MNAAGWLAAKSRIDPVFEDLKEAGLVVLQDAGYTESDGFSDCLEEFLDRGGKKAGLHGFCFYSRQDLNRAKQSSELYLAFWGAPEGGPKDMERVGNLIVAAFQKHGFIVDWNGTGAVRPTVYLQRD